MASIIACCHYSHLYGLLSHPLLPPCDRQHPGLYGLAGGTGLGQHGVGDDLGGGGQGASWKHRNRYF